MVKVDSVVKTADGAIGLVVEWVDHGMRPGIFTINWDETTYTGEAPPRHWTRAEAEALAVLN